MPINNNNNNIYNNFHSIIIKDNWLDIEQTIFLIINNLTCKRHSKYFLYPIIFFHCESIYELIASQAYQIDNYIDLDNMILSIQECIRKIENPNEVNIFIKAAIRMLTEFFIKINTSITSIDKITTIIKLIFFSLLENKNILNITFENLCHSLKRIKSSFYKPKEKFNFDENLNNNNNQESITLQKTIIEMREILECYFYFVLKFTKDVSNGKKIWLILENHIENKFNSEKITNRLIDLIILFTIGKFRNLKNFSDRLDSNNINRDLIVSTILEFVSDKFFNSRIIIPNEKSEYLKNHSVTLFTELICNYSDLLPLTYMSSESFIKVKIKLKKNFN
jgi:hypothetical protein